MPGDSFSIGLRYVYRILVTAAALLILYAVYDALRHGEPSTLAFAGQSTSGLKPGGCVTLSLADTGLVFMIAAK
jgi:hypothetical protein